MGCNNVKNGRKDPGLLQVGVCPFTLSSFYLSFSAYFKDHSCRLLGGLNVSKPTISEKDEKELLQVDGYGDALTTVCSLCPSSLSFGGSNVLHNNMDFLMQFSNFVPRHTLCLG